MKKLLVVKCTTLYIYHTFRLSKFSKSGRTKFGPDAKHKENKKYQLKQKFKKKDINSEL
eukprot:SAG22_NODE_7046_length_782_cov_1.235725_2_plen_58_part_01